MFGIHFAKHQHELDHGQTCAQMGTCQNCKIRCLLCTDDPHPWSPDEVTCTPLEELGYWVIVSACCAIAAAAGGFIAFVGYWLYTAVSV